MDFMFNGWIVAARHKAVQVLLAGAAVVVSGPVQSHGTTVGALQIDHPYAVPTAVGQTEGAVYFRAIRNTRAQADRLIAAQTPVAQAVQLQGDAAPHAAGIALPAHSVRVLRHERGAPLRLQGLQRPLRVGDRFVLTLHFEYAGTREVVVWVQQPRESQASHHAH